MKFNEKTILEYANNVSEKSSVPGGGSVLALVNELSASLLLMVARFTLNKQGYEEYSDRMLEMIDVLENSKKRCHELIDEDAISFSELMSAYSSKDESLINASSIRAAEVPKDLYLEAKKLICLAEELISKGNKNVVSDAQIAYDLSFCSLKSCLHHIQINIDSITDENVKRNFVLFIEGERK